MNNHEELFDSLVSTIKRVSVSNRRFTLDREALRVLDVIDEWVEFHEVQRDQMLDRMAKEMQEDE